MNVKDIPKGKAFMHKSGEMISDGNGMAHRVVGVFTKAEGTPHKVSGTGEVYPSILSKALDKMLSARMAWSKSNERVLAAYDRLEKLGYPEQRLRTPEFAEWWKNNFDRLAQM